MDRRVAGLVSLSFVLAASFGALPALAEDGSVSVRVETVLASNKGTEVDPPDLAKMKDTFQKQNFSFTSFKRLALSTVKLTPVKKTADVKLPNGVNASLTLMGVKDGTATVRVDVPRQSTTDVELGRQGSIYQLAGSHVGGKLILVLAQP